MNLTKVWLKRRFKPAAFFNVLLAGHTARLKEAYMKKLSAGIAALALLVSLVLAGCDGILSDDKKGSLEAPTGLSATLNGSNIRLTWYSVDDADGYTIYRATSSGGNYSSLDTSSGSSYTDSSSLDANTTYYYKVSAYNDYGESPMSSVASAKTGMVAPSNLKATASLSSITLDWDSIVGATGYRVYRNTVSYENGDLLTSVLSPAHSYEDTGVSSGTTYYYRVAMYDSTGDGPTASASAALLLSAPEGLTVELVSNGVKLSWESVTGATSYNVYRNSSATGTYTSLISSNNYPPTPTYTDTSAYSGSSYYYQVVARDSSGNEGVRTEYKSTIDLLSAPTNLSATAASSSSITLTWYGVDGADNYHILRRESDSTDYSPVGTGGTLSGSTYIYTDTGLDSHKQYYYKVAAMRNGNDGAQSSSDYATTLYAAPGNFKAEATSSTSITLSWDRLSDVYYYRVSRSTEDQTNYTVKDSAYYASNATITYTDVSSFTSLLSANTTYYYKVVAVRNSGPELGDESEAVSETTLLEAPTVSATAASSSSISLSWNAIEDASGYKILRSNYADNTNYPYEEIGSTANGSNTDYLDSGLESHTTHYYKVSAVDSSDRAGERSSYGSARTRFAAPENLSYIATSTSITLSWKSVSGANRYYVSYSDSLNGEYTSFSPNSSSTSYSHTTGLSANRTYYYKIGAAYYDNSYGTTTETGEESAPFPATTLLPAPQSFTATSLSSSSIKLSWAELTDTGVSGYYVYRRDSNGNYEQIPGGDTSENSYTDLDLDSYTRYYYKVAAHNSTGTAGDQSDSADTRTVIGITTAKPKSTSVYLSWNSANSQYYNVYRSDSENGTYTKLGSPANYTTSSYTTNYTDSTVVAYSTYYYKVATSDFSGNVGAMSDPFMVVAEDSISNVTVEYVGDPWTDSSGVYQSPAISDNEDTKARVKFTSYKTDVELIITLSVSSESNGDYAYIGFLDIEGASKNAGYFSERISGSDNRTITITVPAIGDHFILIGYAKDGSISTGSDNAEFTLSY
jgi:fibronectin type 3 domain-containing protein